MHVKATHDRAISLVICTRNRAAALRGCLDSLAALQFEPRAWELIVVNNASTDNTDEVLQAFAREVPFRATVVQSQRPGLSRARNSGVAATHAPIVAFTDDDCYVAPDFLTRIVDVFRREQYGYIGGRVLLHDPSDAPETIKEDTEAAEIAPYSCVPPGFIHGANMAFRREVWDAVGGFDPLLGSGTRFIADDVDFLGRVSAAGWPGAYRPEPVVRHHHGRKPGPDVAKLRTLYARGRGAYYIKGCLDARMRPQYSRHWYWNLRLLAKQKRFPEAMNEIAAGAEYLMRSLLQPRPFPWHLLKQREGLNRQEEPRARHAGMG
jgi:glycosyltransferase involved in cell wall biosynthesis